MDVNFNYNDTISTVNSRKPSVVDLDKKDPVLLKSDKSSNTILPITQVEDTINTDDVISSSGKRYIIEVESKDDTYKTDHTRNFYRGRSFRFAGAWTEGVHYICDEYVIDFVVKDNALLACTKSHMSSQENKPTEWIYKGGNKYAVVSDYWDLVIAGTKGESGGVFLPSYDEVTDQIVWVLVPEEAVESPIYLNLNLNERIDLKLNPINAKITNIEGDVLDLSLTATHLSSRLETAEGNIGQLILTAQEFNISMLNAEGDISQLKQTAREISSTVESNKQLADNAIAANRSLITQTAEEIRSEVESNVNRLDASIETYHSEFRQTAEEITSTVERNKQETDGAIEFAKSEMRQTADEISSEVERNKQDVDGSIAELRSNITQTAEQISAEVSRVEQDLTGNIESAKSEFRQTADEIATTVEQNKIDLDGDIAELQSRITQTAESITSTVEANKRDTDGALSELNSEIQQTAEEITFIVNANKTDTDNSIEQLSSRITQTAEEIRSEVESNKITTDGAIENLSSELTQTAEQISSVIQKNKSDADDAIEALNSRITQTAEDITSVVESNKQDADGKIEQLDSTIVQTASEIRSEVSASVSDLSGQLQETKSEFIQTAESLESRVINAEGNVSTLTQDVSNVTARVFDAEGDISQLQVGLNGVSADVTTLSQDFGDYQGVMTNTIEHLQNQIDGAIETWYAEGEPGLNKYPVTEWEQEDWANHIGDLYYDKLTGKAYRFMLDASKNPAEFVWTEISDSDIAKALALAGEKKRIFTTPTTPYDVNDLWIKTRTVNVEGQQTTVREIYRCVNARADGDPVLSDWVPADDYGTTVNKANLKILSDSILGQVVQYTYNNDGTITDATKSSIQSTANSIRLAVVQGAVGENGIITNALLPTGIDIINGEIVLTANRIKLQNQNAVSGLDLITIGEAPNQRVLIDATSLNVNGIFSTSPGSVWATEQNNLKSYADDAASDAQLAAEANAQGFANTAEQNANDYSDSRLQDAKDYTDLAEQAAKSWAETKASEAVTSANTYVTNLLWGNGSQQQPAENSILALLNSDISTLNNGLTTTNSNLSTLDNQINSAGGIADQLNAATQGLSDIGYLAEALWDGDTAIAGGLIVSSLIQLGSKVHNNTDIPVTDDSEPLNHSTWRVWSGINGVYSPSSIGGGIAAWYGGEMLDRAIEGNDDSKRAANSLFRFDGSGYLAKGRISWDDTGSLYIDKNVIVGDNNETLNSLITMLADFRSWFEVVPIVINGVNRKALHLKTGTDVELAGFYADGFISAGGLSTGSGTEGVDIAGVWQSLTNQSSDAYANTLIARSHLPIATKYTTGIVRIGEGLSITSEGVLSAASGTVTSIGLSMPTGFTISGSPITESGTISVTFANGYSLPSTTKQSQWDTAYGWGNHASVGYLTNVVVTSANADIGTTLTKIATVHGVDIKAKITHQSLNLYAGANNGTAQASQTDPYILLIGGGVNKGSVQLKGAGSVSISSNDSGSITISGVNTTYKLTVNGTVNGDSTNGISLGTIYAPTSAGNVNQILMANASGIPTWHTLTQSDVFGSNNIGSTSLPVYYNGTNGLSTISSLSLQGDIVTTTNVKASRFYLDTDVYFIRDQYGVKLVGAGFYTDDFVSAGGYSEGEGAEGIDWSALTTSGEQQIHISHLNNALSNYVNAVSTSGTGDFVQSINKNGSTVVVTYGSLPASVKNPNSLIVGTKSYDGSEEVTIVASDIGISSWATASTKPSYSLSEISGTTDLRLIEALTGAGFLKRKSNNTWELDNNTYLTTGDAASTYQPLDSDLTAIASISTGTGLLKRSVFGTTVTWTIDTNQYITGNQNITLSGDVSGSGTTSIEVTIGTGKVTNAMLAGSIANNKLTNSSITINGSSVSLGGSFSTASITAGTAGQSTASTGADKITIPYVTVNKYGIVTGYGTHEHTIDDLPNSALKYSSITIGSTSISLGGTSTTIAGLSKITSSTYSAGGKLEDNTTESTITYDATNHAWKITGNLYATGFISSGGLSDGTGTTGIDWDALTTSGTQKIHYSHLPITLTQNTGDYVTGVTYSNGVFTVTRGTLATTIGWDNIDDKPTTLSGYGITDGVNSVTVSGSGNAVTTATISGHTLTLTKGTTFLTSVTLASGTNNGTLKLTVNGTTTDNIAVKGLGAAAYKAVGSVASGNTGLVTGGAVYTAINDVVTSAIKFRGVTTTSLSDGSTTNPITIDSESYTAKSGDLVISGGLEFLWTGSKWQLLGDESSYVPKTTTVNGHALTGNISLNKSDVGLGNVTNLAASGYFTLFEMDSTDTTKTSITIGGTNKMLVIGYATKAKQDADGNEIKTSYGASLGAAANALTLKSKSGVTLSTITSANIVTVLSTTAVNRATGDKNGNDIYATYVSGVAVGTGNNSSKLAITKAGSTTYITVPYATLANTVTTTADTTNTLYLVGVTSNATTTLKHNTGITMKNGALSVSGLTVSTSGITVTAGGVTISAGGLTVTGNTTLSNKVFLGTSSSYTAYDANNGSFLEWDNTNKAWHVVGNLYADGFVSAGGLNTSGSGSTSVTFLDYSSIKSLASDTDFTTASAWATHLFYQDVFGSGNTTIVSRINALENSSTNVQYTASQSSGTLLGTITIDGTANKIYAPTIPTTLKNPKSLKFGTQSYDGSAEKTIQAKDLSACVVGTVVGTVTITT